MGSLSFEIIDFSETLRRATVRRCTAPSDVLVSAKTSRPTQTHVTAAFYRVAWIHFNTIEYVLEGLLIVSPELQSATGRFSYF